MTETEVVIVGGGPTGIACAAELKKRGIENLIIEKGSVTESLRKYPKRMVFFSTAENIEIADVPFPTSNVKPTRTEALQYYRKVASFYNLKMKLFTEVTGIQQTEHGFVTTTNEGKQYRSTFVVLATGYFDFPRKLNIPGEDLPHVTHYYDEPYKYSFSKVAIVGAGNSAVSAALELYRHDVDVTIVHRGNGIKKTAKYWLVPDLKNRIKEGKVKTRFQREVKGIKPGELILENTETGVEEKMETDFVLLLTGYLPDVGFLKKVGLEIDPETLKTPFDEHTFETKVKNLFLCGTVLAGIRTESVFIENGRDHAKAIAEEVKLRLGG